MANAHVSWKFPANLIFLRIETTFVLILGLLVFLLTYFQERSWFFAVMFTFVFLGLYAIIGSIIHKIMAVEEQYQVDASHLSVVRKNRFKTKTEKIPLHTIKRHKVDKFFHGGYVVSDKGKHLLFFNNKKEVEKFDDHMTKHRKNAKKKR